MLNHNAIKWRTIDSQALSPLQLIVFGLYSTATFLRDRSLFASLERKGRDRPGINRGLIDVTVVYPVIVGAASMTMSL